MQPLHAQLISLAAVIYIAETSLGTKRSIMCFVNSIHDSG